MDVEPKEFEQHSKNVKRNNKEWLGRFAVANDQETYDIVLDIGCGTGYLTRQLDGDLKVGQIYGIDIDEKMIGFAKQNHSKDNIFYIQQNFGVEFDCMAPELRALEGKVSLILSLNTLQYILDKKTVVENLKRFLTKGGKVYTEIVHVFDPFMDLTAEEKAIHEMVFMKIPERQKHFNDWLNSFKSVDFKVIENEYLFLHFIHSEMNFKKYTLPLLLANFRNYFIDKTDIAKVELNCNEISAKIMSNNKAFTDDPNGGIVMDNIVVYFVFIIEK